MIAMNLYPGDLVTTDRRVQEEFGLSRATARKAIDELVDEGLVERVAGETSTAMRSVCLVNLDSSLPGKVWSRSSA